MGSVTHEYVRTLRSDGPHPLEAEVEAAIEAIRLPTEVLLPRNASYFHSGWSVHREEERRGVGRRAARGEGEPALDAGSERYSATLGIYVEYVPSWPFRGYLSVSATGSHLDTAALVPEVQELRDRMNGTGAHAGEGRKEGLLGEFKALVDRLRGEERARGLALLAAELGRRGIPFESTGSTLTAAGERREDEHKRTSLNRRAAAIHVPFPEPAIEWRDSVTRMAVAQGILERLAAERGTDVNGLLASEAEAVLDSRERGFATDGTVLAAGVTCRRHPLGGLVPFVSRDGDAAGLPPLDTGDA